MGADHMDVASRQSFFEQKSIAEKVLLLSNATTEHELEEAVQALIDRHLGVDHFSLFVQIPHHKPVVLAAGSRDRNGESSALARAYAARFCQWDTVANDTQECSADGQVTIHNRRAKDITNSLYRRECYDKPGIAERLTIRSRERDGTSRILHLYRKQHRPSFTHADLSDALSAAAWILTAIPNGRRGATKQVGGGRQRLPWFIDRLHRLPERLTERECEVCARALIGMTIEGTALDLGVAPTSVATYRKRAYQKLNITSQNEMFALIY